MDETYLISGDLAAAPKHPTCPPLPRPVTELHTFLRSTAALGAQVTFWRSKARLPLLKAATYAMRSTLLEEPPAPGTGELQALIHFYEELLLRLTRVAESIPFQNRVGLLRRNLITTFQQIFILKHLCQSIVCKLRMRDPKRIPVLPAGSLVGADARATLRNTFRNLAPGWDKETWDAYDHL